MGTDLTVFANHSIDFSIKDYDNIALKILNILDDININIYSKIKEQIRGYYDWQGYNGDEIRKK